MGQYLDEFGFDELDRMFTETVTQYPTLKRTELFRLGKIYQGLVRKHTPVDTSRLAQSIDVELLSEEEIMVGTNVEYAEAVENGHVQHKRFLPAKYLQGSVKGRKYLGKKNSKGIMLKEKFVQGSHMFTKATFEYPPKMEAEVEAFVKAMFRQMFT